MFSTALIRRASSCSRAFCLLRATTLVLTLLFATIAVAAPKLSRIGPCTDSAVPEAVKKALAPDGYRVALDDGSTVDLWPRSVLPTGSKAREDATYAITPSTFVGVIHFAKNTRDYRGDAVPAGTYNLRYELQPSDGNHLGTSPTPDFLLLIPADADSDPDHSYNFQQLVELSEKVTSKKHPAALNLVAPQAKDFPAINEDLEDHTILFFKARTQSGDLPLALVIKGTTAE